MSRPLQIGETVLGEVIAIKPFGAFVSLPSGDTGLIHISEVAEEYVRDINKYLAVGEEVAVKVIGINEEGKYNLSLKQVTSQDEEAVRYFLKVQEFRKALEKRREELQFETSGRRLARERQKMVSSSRASLLNWMKQARKSLERIQRRSDERKKSYDSFEL